MNIIKRIAITLSSGVVIFFTVYLSVDSPFLRSEPTNQPTLKPSGFPTSSPSFIPTTNPTNYTEPTPIPTELLYEDYSIQYSNPFLGKTATRSLPTNQPF
jgi:hypothetical protein